MHLDIITADKNLFNGEVTAVTLPGSKGKFQILEGHAALISSLDKGNVVVESAAGKQEFSIHGGLVEVLNNRIIVLA
jgi:F-type H+-transporting ATPase subunit epsilon